MDSFSDQFEKRNWAEVSAKINSTTSKNIERALEGAGEGGMDDLAALLSPLANKEYLEDMAQLANQLTMQSFTVFFAAVIAVGVVYNTARISLDERSRELARQSRSANRHPKR